jgi:hypothetical protein
VKLTPNPHPFHVCIKVTCQECRAVDNRIHRAWNEAVRQTLADVARDLDEYAPVDRYAVSVLARLADRYTAAAKKLP